MLLLVVKGEWVMSGFALMSLWWFMLLGFPADARPGFAPQSPKPQSQQPFSFFLSVPSGTESIAKRSTQRATNMQLGLRESLPALVAKRFTAAKESGHLIFSHTHLSIINSGGISVGCALSIPFQGGIAIFELTVLTATFSSINFVTAQLSQTNLQALLNPTRTGQVLSPILSRIPLQTF
jgi:hypothetical protein